MKFYIFFDGIYNWPILSGKHYLAQTLALNNDIACFDRPNIGNLINLIAKPFQYAEKISNRLTVIHSFSLFPKSQSNLTIDKLNYYLNYKIFRLLIGNNNDTTIISYTPELYLIEKYFQNNKIFYYVVDDYLSYPLWSSKKSRNNFLFLEKKFIKICKGIITSSITLYEKYSKLHKNVFYFPNPSPVKDFLNVQFQNNNIPKDIKNIKKPIVGFIGGIENYRFNLKLIKMAAKKYSEYSFVFIGPLNWIGKKRKVKLPSYNNIFHLGIKPHNILRGYLNYFDVTIIPYKLNNYGKACFPMKIFEYLALGKPVVTSALPSIKHLSDKKLIYWSENNKQFIENIKRGLVEKNNKKTIKARMQEANINDWNMRINQFINIIKKQ